MNYSLIRHSLCKTALMAAMLAASLVQADNYAMWQIPSSGVQFPIYVLKNGQQAEYLYSTSQQSILGTIDKHTSAHYSLYYQSSKTQWNSCNFSLKNGAIDTSKTNCPGAVINAPAKNANVYTIAFGATSWPTTNQKPAYITPIYSGRSLVFKNNTTYDAIRIGQVCTTSKNPHNTECQNNQNRWELNKGDTQVFHYDSTYQGGLTGLNSTAFTVTAYKQNGNWIETGGYGKNGTPYATKVEMTALPVPQASGVAGNFPVPQGNTNFDISAVDGYNISAKAHPLGGSYCTYTVPPENSNILGAGYYDETTPIASITSDKQLCGISSQLPKGYSGPETAWDLIQKDSSGNYQGCLSPCTYAKTNGKSTKDMFCCTNSYGTPGSCDQHKGQLGANNSSYVTNLNNNHAIHVYRFAYDDAIGDFACPAHTSIAVAFE